MFELPLSAPSHTRDIILHANSRSLIRRVFRRSFQPRSLARRSFGPSLLLISRRRSDHSFTAGVGVSRTTLSNISATAVAIFQDYPAVDDYHAPLSPPGVGDTRSSCRQIRSAHLGPCPVGIVVNQGPPDSCLVDRIALARFNVLGGHCGTAAPL